MKKVREDFERVMSLTLKAVVVGEEGKVLVIKRSKKDKLNAGKWDLPGGHIDQGETIEEGLKRELQEETGLKIKVGPIVKVSEFEKESSHFKNEKRGLRYIVFSQDREVKINRKEHSGYEWLPLEEAIEKFDEKDGFEKEKKETLIKAKEYLELLKGEERWKRAMADFENYKKRTAKSNEEFRKYCKEEIILDLLPVLDNFEAATEHVPEESSDDGWVVGIMHIQKQLKDVLEKNGVTEIDVKVGDRIDESIQEVIKGTAKKNKVAGVLKKGYKIADRVIRPASVETK